MENNQNRFLKKIIAKNISNDLKTTYPFNLDYINNELIIEFPKKVTIFVGENGCGKSTILETIAYHIGFNLTSGNRNHLYSSQESVIANLEERLTFSWQNKTSNGFFLRAESFYEFTKFIDNDPNISKGYGFKFEEKSHGQTFLKIFQRLPKGVIILDEPESALSPLSQLTLIKIISELNEIGDTQFIIATHSPILLSIPGAQIYEIRDGGMEVVDFKDTKHFQLFKNFCNSPEQYLKYLLE